MAEETAPEQLDPEFRAALDALKGKIVKVRMKVARDVTTESGAADFYFADFVVKVLDPAVRRYPENNPQGILALFGQSQDSLQRVFAFNILSIEEIDDDPQPQVVQIAPGVTIIPTP